MKTQSFFFFLLVLTALKPCFSQQSGVDLFDASVLHQIKIEFEEADFWEILIENYNSSTQTERAEIQKTIGKVSKEKTMQKVMQVENTMSDSPEIPYLQASIAIDGIVVDPVGVRLKGFSSFFSSPHYRKSLKIDFNEFNDTNTYLGLKKINLNNGVGDASLQRDFLCYGMMRKAGIAAPRVSYAEVYLNDVYWGVFVIVEQIDKTFLTKNFPSGKGNLFKNIGWSDLNYEGGKFSAYSESIELKTNEDEADGNDFVNLVKSIDKLSSKKLADSIQKLFYTDYFFKILSIDIITKNWDSYAFHGRNFYLYHEPVSDIFYWIPWDYNLALHGNFNHAWGFSDDCDSKIDFTYDTLGTEVSFHLDIDGNNSDFIWWDFGDSKWSEADTGTNPTHTYNQRGIYNVSVHTQLSEACFVEKRKKVVLIDSSGLCPSAKNRMGSYIPSDTLDQIYLADSYCCDCNWDEICENELRKRRGGDTLINDTRYPVSFSNEKVLIRKLFANEAFKNRYLDIFKFVLDSVFDSEQMLSSVEANANLIRDAVYRDTNYLFTTEEFEHELNNLFKPVQNGINLWRLLNYRKDGLVAEYKALGYEHKPIRREVKPNEVVINEVAANNIDESGETDSDWIELYNNSKSIIPLSDFTLTDDSEEIEKWTFHPKAVIRPDGYVIVYADNKDKKHNLHANFKLSSDGEELILSHKEYGQIDSVVFGNIFTNLSFQRLPNGTGPFEIADQSFNYYNARFIPSNLTEPYSEHQQFIVYPNPAKEFVTIQSKAESGEFSVRIFNSSGQLFVNKDSDGDKISIDVSEIPNGIYIIEFKMEQQISYLKLLVRH